MLTSPDHHIHLSVDHLFRHRAGQMIAVLTRLFGLERLDQIEDAVQDAMVRALKHWPHQGVPENPTAWLIQTAKHRLFDQLRRDQRLESVDEQLNDVVSTLLADSDAHFVSEVRDDQLQMIFICCHPTIPADSQVALTLKTVSGFSVAEIARAFLAQESAVAKMLVRARQRLREHRVRLEMPASDQLPARLEAALRVLYLMFNEGYCAMEGDELVRTDLCHEAIRLAELLADHPITSAPKVHALAALLLFQSARLTARCDAAGELLLLAEQDRSLWNHELLRRALHHFHQSAHGDELSDYHLEAEIASCHALAVSFAATDWPRVLRCYEELLRRQPSPVVALNRLIALAQLHGAAAGLAELEKLSAHRLLKNYYPLYATRGEFLRMTGKTAEAITAYQTALQLTSSEPIRRFLQKRMAELKTL